MIADKEVCEVATKIPETMAGFRLMPYAMCQICGKIGFVDLIEYEDKSYTMRCVYCGAETSKYLVAGHAATAWLTGDLDSE